jgi:hypothetical protein
MSTPNDGGPAFPIAPLQLTLRDYFAAHCPSDIAIININEDRVKLAGPRPSEDSKIHDKLQWNALVEAKLRYIYADAMLKAREGKQ